MKKVFFACLLVATQVVYAADLTEVTVFGEKIDACNLSDNSVTAALVGVMKYNRIKISESFSGVLLYHKVNAMKTSFGCIVHAKVDFRAFEKVFIESFNKKVMSEIVFCSRGTLLTGPEYDMQTRINNSLKDYAQQCLLEISKK